MTTAARSSTLSIGPAASTRSTSCRLGDARSIGVVVTESTELDDTPDTRLLTGAPEVLVDGPFPGDPVGAFTDAVDEEHRDSTRSIASRRSPPTLATLSRRPDARVPFVELAGIADDTPHHVPARGTRARVVHPHSPTYRDEPAHHRHPRELDAPDGDVERGRSVFVGTESACLAFAGGGRAADEDRDARELVVKQCRDVLSLDVWSPRTATIASPECSPMFVQSAFST